MTGQGSKPCGAKTRSGGRCKKTGLANGRCRFHGGLTPIGPASPHWKTGARSKWGMLPAGLAKHYARTSAQSDAALMTLTGELALIDARVSEQLEAIGQTGSAKLWAEARTTFDAIKVGAAASVRGGMEKLDELLERGAQASATWDALLELLEARRKMVETESRRRKDAQETLSIQQAMAIVSLLARVVKEHVRDPNEQAAVFSGLQRLLRPMPAVQTVGEVAPGKALVKKGA